ncbi:hypothetical protein NST23_26570 [Brevibacillus sp. FSL K6-0770]|uniref:hypothetical protein n=1 Tax=Brevibacillus sp. FSL K6-0770 TaxID=2954673 RepID=UPI0030F5DCBF
MKLPGATLTRSSCSAGLSAASSSPVDCAASAPVAGEVVSVDADVFGSVVASLPSSVFALLLSAAEVAGSVPFGCSSVVTGGLPASLISIGTVTVL